MEPIRCQPLPFYCHHREDLFDEGQDSLNEANPAEASPAEGLPPLNNFLLLFDPGPDPLRTPMELCLWEVRYGLVLGSFNPGTRLHDQKSGLTHTVCRKEGKDTLEPDCARLKRGS